MHRAFKAIVIVACFQLALSGTAYASPKIVFSEGEYDFGKLEQGKNGEHVFRFSNAGSEPLKIDRIKTSCGCTASSTEKDLIQPGEEGEIKVVYKSKNRSGPFHQKIRVFTNDPEQQETILEIRGVVELGPAPVIEVGAPYVDLGIIHMSNPAQVALSVRNAGSELLKIYSIADYRGGVLFEGELTITPGGDKTLDLVYKPQKSGMLKETYFITSNDPRRPRLPIYFNGYVEDKEIITITKENGTTYSFQNNTSATLTVVPEKAKQGKKTIAPGKSVKVEFPPRENPTIVTFSVELETTN